MRRVVVVCVLCLAPGPALFAQSVVYRVAWWDAASLGGAGVLALLADRSDLPHGPPPCAPCDPASLPAIDHAALHTFSGSAASASTVGVVGLVAATGLASVVGLPARQARGNAAVFATGIAWTTAATEWLKIAVHRSRPILYT